MISNSKRQLRQRMPWLYRRLRACHGALLESLVAPFHRRRFQREFCLAHGIESYAPRIGLQSVFIAKENILFLEEWILYHKSLGVEYFFLYDNSAVEVTKESFAMAGAQVGKTGKRGIPYDAIVTMTDDEIQEELDRIQNEIPGVFVYEWSPMDENGKIYFGQAECINRALKIHQDVVDWMLILDMDEYLVPGNDLVNLCKRMTIGGYVGAEFQEYRMDNRYKHLDKAVCEIVAVCKNPHPRIWWEPGGKTLCYLPRTNYAEMHYFLPFIPRVKMNHDAMHYRHYKCHHSHESAGTVPPLGFNTSRDPSWKLKRARSNWKSILDDTRGPMNHREIESVMEKFDA